MASKTDVGGTIYGVIKKLVGGPVMAVNVEGISLFISGLRTRSPWKF
jgi:hypothetical protein